MSELEKATIELNEATIFYKHAYQAYSIASKKVTAAINLVNEKQRAFDLAVSAIKEQSPNDCDWKQSKHRVEAAV